MPLQCQLEVLKQRLSGIKAKWFYADPNRGARHMSTPVHETLATGEKDPCQDTSECSSRRQSRDEFGQSFLPVTQRRDACSLRAPVAQSRIKRALRGRAIFFA